jgi:hypothetical protein
MTELVGQARAERCPQADDHLTPRRASVGRRQSTSRELFLAAAVLLIVGTAVAWTRVVHGNFSYDDWALAAGVRYSGVWSMVSLYLHIDHRPLVALYLPLVQAATDENARVQLAWIVLAHIGMCWCVCLFLRTAGVPFYGCLAIALLTLVFPFADASWLYVIASAATVSVTLYLLGATAALKGLDRVGKQARLWHGLAICLYIASVLTYELALIPIVLSGVLYLCKARWATVRAVWAADVVAMCLTVLCFTSRAVPILPGGDVHGQLPLSQQLSHIKLIYSQARGVVAATLEPFGIVHYNRVLVAMLLILGVALLTWRLLPKADPTRADLKRWLVLAAFGLGGAGAGWLVLAPADPYYSPGVLGVGTRINAFVAIPLSVLVFSLAAIVGTLVARVFKARAYLPIGITLAAVLAVWFGDLRHVLNDKTAWDRAASLQRHELSVLRRSIPTPAPGTRMLAFGSPGFAALGVPVFAAPWDLDGAVKLLWNNGTLAAYPVIAGTVIECLPSEVVPVGAGYATDQSAPYGTVYFVDVASGRAVRIRSQQQCVAQLGRFRPGALLG